MALPVAAATSTPYDIAPGTSETFIVPGEDGSVPTLHQQQGNARIVSASYLAGHWFVTIECEASSSTDCEGTIET